jgi:TM2 domain-containing membrane protein YozV
MRTQVQAQERAAVDMSRAIPACLLGWLLPGAGHFYLGRHGKGATFLLSLLAMFLLGLGWDARLQMQMTLEDPLALLRSIAQMAIGAPYFVARAIGAGMGPVTSVTHEYGNTFTEVGGLLNILVMIDAWDTALGRKK